MKNSLKTLLAVAGAAMATSVAQANTYTELGSDVLVDTLTGAQTTATPNTFNVTSEVLTDGVAGPNEYEYTYTIQSTGPLANVVSVFGVFGLAGSTANNFNGPGSWNIGSWDTLSTINWDASSGVQATAGLTYSFESPYGPTLGNFGVQDGTTWGSQMVVYVPNAPDGGMTMTLLGGTLLGLGALRRKLGC